RSDSRSRARGRPGRAAPWLRRTRTERRRAYASSWTPGWPGRRGAHYARNGSRSPPPAVRPLGPVDYRASESPHDADVERGRQAHATAQQVAFDAARLHAHADPDQRGIVRDRHAPRVGDQVERPQDERAEHPAADEAEIDRARRDTE